MATSFTKSSHRNMFAVWAVARILRGTHYLASRQVLTKEIFNNCER